MSKICIILLLMQLSLDGTLAATVTDKINDTLVEAVTVKFNKTTVEAVTDNLDAATTIFPHKNCDDIKCPSVPKHYEELGCEAVKDEDECCASSFKCPDLTTRDITKCYYKNEVLNATEYLKESSLGGMCAAGCHCRKGRRGKPAELQCAHVDCPDIFDGPEEKSAKCVKQYSRASCCSTQSVCDDDVDKLATCEFEGELYREGQKIYPNERCYECFCTNNFDNKTSVEENPNCHKIDCGITLRNTARLMDGCVPVYFQRDNCCPIGWRCPGENHMVESDKSRNATDLSPKCVFGKVELNIGDVLENLDDEDCQKCTCKTPPMVHCISSC